jgi:hypothetical protein
MARTPAISLQGRDGINQCEGVLRVVTIGPGKLNDQRNSAPVANQMTLAAQLRPLSCIRTCLRPPKNCPHGTAVHNCSRPIFLTVAGQPIQQREEDQLPDACLLPVAQPSPATRPRTTVHLLRQHPPRNPASQNEQNALEASAIGEAWSSTLGFGRWSWKKRFDQIPQSVRKKRRGHGKSVRVTTMFSSSV